MPETAGQGEGPAWQARPDRRLHKPSGEHPCPVVSISAVLAVSMSITAIVPLTATPVAADSTRLDRRNDDAAKLIMGAAAIAILGAAIANKTKQDEKREKDRKKDKERREAEKHKPRYEHPRRGIQLSQRCIVDQRGRGDAYDADCLARQGVRVRDLPGQCRSHCAAVTAMRLALTRAASTGSATMAAAGRAVGSKTNATAQRPTCHATISETDA